jgi:hypothetical protein
MLRRKNMLLQTGLVLLGVGCVVFFNPFHNEPLWMEWLVGPVLMYLGLPLAMVGTAIHFFGGAHKGATSAPHVKARG